MERKLSTIFALDVVSFSKLMAKDEANTLKTLNKRRTFIDALIEEYDGRIFNTAGDSVLAEFTSPVRALECAIQIQNNSQALNNIADDNNIMSFRIGINIGDVMISDDNLFGDAVNIAARLEAEAIVDGICISQSIFDMVNLKVKVSYEDAGELDLKNIERPIKAYNVLKSKGATRRIVNSDEAPKIKFENVPPGSVAVMLFKNLSKDEEQDYFCEGFSEDLVSALSRYKNLFVSSSNASFSYSLKEKAPADIGVELGVMYLLEGKVRKLGNKIRITASLIIAENGNTIWSNNFDAELDNIFDVQDELILNIVSKIVGNVERDQVQQLANSKPENMRAYDLVLQGLEFHRKSSILAENNKKALALFTQAIEVDPSYARAYAWKACSLGNNAEWYPDDMPKNWIEDALGSLDRSLELDPNDPEAHRIMGAVKLLFEGDIESAIFHHEKAIEICPSDTYHIARYTILLCYLGKPDKGLLEIERAMRIDPFCSDLVLEAQGLCFYVLKKFKDAVTSFKKMQIDTRNSLFYHASSLQELGENEKATNTLNIALNESGMSIEKFISTQLFKNKDTLQSLKLSLVSIQQ